MSGKLKYSSWNNSDSSEKSSKNEKKQELQEHLKPDKRLENWKRWMEIRKKYHESVRMKLKRYPMDVIGNKSDTYRTKVQERMMIQNSKIVKPDKYRGCPGYWKYPCGIVIEPPCPCRAPIFGPVKKEQICKVPSVEIIGTAQKIREEKNINGDVEGTFTQDMWQSSRYKRKVESKMSKYFKPAFYNLCVVGENIKNKQKESTEKSNSAFKMGSSISEFTEPETDDVVVALEFGETILSNKITKPEIKKYYFYINYLIPNDGIIQNKIKIQNIGNITVDFQWKRVLPIVTLDIIPKREPKFSFAFQKMRQILLLDETKYVTIYFSTSTPGFYEETWILETVPTIQNIQFYLILRANAVFGLQDEIINNLQERLDEGIKNKIIDDTMVDLLSRVHILKPDVDYVYNKRMATQKEVFESVNLDVKNNLKPIYYHYNKYVINAFKELYKEVRTESDPEYWNLKLDDLKKLINKIKDPLTRSKCDYEFKSLVDQLLKTNLIRNVEHDRHAQIYYILCSVIDQITDKLQQIHERYGIKINDTFPKITIDTLIEQCVNVPTRKIKLFPKQTCRTIYEKNVLEKPCEENEALKNISIDDPENLYKVYRKEIYGIDESSKKTKKGKKEKPSKDKSNKDTKSGKSTKAKPVKKTPPVDTLLSFTNLLPTYPPEQDEPEEYLPMPSAETTSSYNQSSDTTYSDSTEPIDTFKHELYIITYELLATAISEIELTLLTFEGRVVRHHLLQKIFDQPLDYWDTESQIQKSSLEESDFETLSAATSISKISSSYSIETEPQWIPMTETVDELKQRENIEFVDKYTETSKGEIWPRKTQEQYMQTIYAPEIDKDHLIERIELETNATEKIVYED